MAVDCVYNHSFCDQSSSFLCTVVAVMEGKKSSTVIQTPEHAGLTSKSPTVDVVSEFQCDGISIVESLPQVRRAMTFFYMYCIIGS